MPERQLPRPQEVSSARMKVTVYPGPILHCQPDEKAQGMGAPEVWESLTGGTLAVPLAPAELIRYGLHVPHPRHRSGTQGSLRWQYLATGSDDPESSSAYGVRPHTLLTLEVGTVDEDAALTYLAVFGADIPGMFDADASPPWIPSPADSDDNDLGW